MSLKKIKGDAKLTILVTGGAGYISSRMIERLLQEGFKVKTLEYNINTLGNLSDFLEDPNFSYIIGDVTKEKDVKKACQDVEVVIHLAGIASIARCRENPMKAISVNGYAVRTILETCKDSKDFKKFIYPSSVAGMYTRPKRDIITADDEVFPINDYGVSKFLGETYCKAYNEMYGLPTTIFRQSNVYGPSPGMKYDSVIHIFVRNAIEGKPLTIQGSGEQARDFVYIDDLIDAYFSVIASEKTNGETYNVCSGEVLKIKEIAEIIQEEVAKKTSNNIEINYISMPLEESEIRKFAISYEKAKNDFGYEPKTKFKEGIAKLISYLT
jgi:UDP-glucose 4-epimerase